MKSASPLSKMLTSNVETLDLVEVLEMNSGFGQGKALLASFTGIPLSSNVKISTMLVIGFLRENYIRLEFSLRLVNNDDDKEK